MAPKRGRGKKAAATKQTTLDDAVTSTDTQPESQQDQSSQQDNSQQPSAIDLTGEPDTKKVKTDDAQTKADDTPAKSDTTQTKINDTMTKADDVKADQNGTATKSDDTPTKQDDTPSKLDDASSKQADKPAKAADDSKGEHKHVAADDQIQVLESGHLYFFYRPKVEKTEVHSADDVQRFYIVMAPTDTMTDKQNEQLVEQLMDQKRIDNQPDRTKHTADQPIELSVPGGEPQKHGDGVHSVKGLERLLNMTSKRLPFHGADGKDAGGGPPASRGTGGRHWSFTEAVGTPAEIRPKLEAYSYSTKTRGERRVSAARAFGIARYKLIRSGGDARTYLTYVLEEPESPGEAQNQFNIRKEGSMNIVVKNPAINFGNVPGLRGDQKPDLPGDLQQLFVGKVKDQLRYAPLDPPAFLNIVGVECIWMGQRFDLEHDVGEKVAEEMRSEADEEMSDYKNHLENLLVADVFGKDDPKVEEHIPSEPLHDGVLV